MKIENFLKESARDIIAFGSPIFFILVLARIFLLSNYSYLSQFIIAGILFLPLIYFFKANIYSGFGLIVLIFTTLYYNEVRFTIFAVFLYLLLIASLFYLKKEKLEIIKGIFFGAVSTGISWFLVEKLFQ
ncbi:MAG: hypothetical protein AABX84_02405 [Nanoarchaeota archaeon]